MSVEDPCQLLLWCLIQSRMYPYLRVLKVALLEDLHHALVLVARAELIFQS